MSTTNEIYDYVMNNPQDTNGSVLGSLLNALPTGGADLPEVTVADNGKVLTVKEGVWTKDFPSGAQFKIVAPYGGGKIYASYNGDVSQQAIANMINGGTSVEFIVPDVEYFGSSECVTLKANGGLISTTVPNLDKVIFSGFRRGTDFTAYYSVEIDGSDTTPNIYSGLTCTRVRIDDPTE